jgi:hypothetical protein
MARYKYTTNSLSPRDDTGTGLVWDGETILIHCISTEGKKFMREAVELMNSREEDDGEKTSGN